MNSGIITGAYIDGPKVPFVNIGEKIILDKYTALNYSSSVVITKSNKIFNIINELNKAKLEGKSEITCEEINNVDLTLPGRVFLNDLIRNHPNFGLELLTKKDLILIWNEISINRDNSKHVDCDIQIVRGSGDVIIDVIKKTLKRVLDTKDTNVSSDDVMMVDKNVSSDDVMMVDNLLDSVKQIQKEVDNFFASSNLCQYLDQVNSLSELSHRNKLTCMDGDKTSQQNVGITTRDPKRWHLAKICPIESPEGQTIGLVLALSTYASIDVNGYLLTGYYKTYNGLINSNVIYLNHFESKGLNIALSCNKNQEK